MLENTKTKKHFLQILAGLRANAATTAVLASYIKLF